MLDFSEASIYIILLQFLDHNTQIMFLECSAVSCDHHWWISENYCNIFGFLKISPVIAVALPMLL